MIENMTEKRQALLELYNSYKATTTAKRETFSYFANVVLPRFDLASVRGFCERFKKQFDTIPDFTEAKLFTDDFVQKFTLKTPLASREQILDKVEELLSSFKLTHRELCDKAKIEGWLGEPWKKGASGLFGYMRTSFGLQIKILENLDFPLPIYPYNREITDFFRSDFFKNTTLKNGYPSAIFKNDHFDILKKL